MTITPRVQQQFFAGHHQAPASLVRLPLTVIMPCDIRVLADPHRRPINVQRSRQRTGLWTVDEHERFLIGLEQFPRGPWKKIAAVVGTKTTRQTMTHAQKYREKINRHVRNYMDAVDPPSVNQHTSSHVSPRAKPVAPVLSVEADFLASATPEVGSEWRSARKPHEDLGLDTFLEWMEKLDCGVFDVAEVDVECQNMIPMEAGSVHVV